jgi:hypothetical protein
VRRPHVELAALLDDPPLEDVVHGRLGEVVVAALLGGQEHAPLALAEARVGAATHVDDLAGVAADEEKPLAPRHHPHVARRQHLLIVYSRHQKGRRACCQGWAPGGAACGQTHAPEAWRPTR